MKISVTLFFLLLPVINFAQADPETHYYTSPLEPGEYIIFAGKSIRFKEVASDSRCPKNVACVWAGEAKVVVEIFEKGRFLEEKIISTNSGNVPLKFQGNDISYGITSLNLHPYPTTGIKKEKPQYTLYITVSEKI